MTKSIHKLFYYWRTRTFYSMFLGYVCFNFTRKSLTYAQPLMIEHKILSHQQLGLLMSLFYIIYGISKFTSGALSDKCNPRYFMSIGLFMTGILNLACGFNRSFFLISFFWGLSAWFQGWGWPPVTKQLTQWFSKSERGRWWSLCSSSHNVGGFLMALAGAKVAQTYGWQMSMYLPGIICMLGSFFLFERLRDGPESVGLKPIEKVKPNRNKSFKPKSIINDLIDKVLSKKAIWALAFAYFFIYLIKTAFSDWTNLYLIKMKNYNSMDAGRALACLEFGGLAGTLFAGWCSDKVFNSKRTPYVILCNLIIMPGIGLFWMLPPNKIYLTMLMTTLMGFLVFGPQMLIGLAAAECVDKSVAGSSNGFAAFFGYCGASVAGYPLTRIVKEYGWNGFFITLVACSVIVIIVLISLWSYGENRRESPIKKKKIFYE